MKLQDSRTVLRFQERQKSKGHIVISNKTGLILVKYQLGSVLPTVMTGPGSGGDRLIGGGGPERPLQGRN